MIPAWTWTRKVLISWKVISSAEKNHLCFYTFLYRGFNQIYEVNDTFVKFRFYALYFSWLESKPSILFVSIWNIQLLNDTYTIWCNSWKLMKSRRLNDSILMITWTNMTSLQITIHNSNSYMHFFSSNLNKGSLIMTVFGSS